MHELIINLVMLLFEGRRTGGRRGSVGNHAWMRVCHPSRRMRIVLGTFTSSSTKFVDLSISRFERAEAGRRSV